MEEPPCAALTIFPGLQGYQSDADTMIQQVSFWVNNVISDEKLLEQERHLEKMMYTAWLRISGETNSAQLEHLKNCVSVAIQECLTEKQKEMLLYYMSGYSQREIADELGLDKSSVSRTIHRAFHNLFSHIKYATPATLHAEAEVKRSLTRLYN